MAEPRPQCTATSKTTGERCKQQALPGHSVCHYHGARGGAPTGNLNGLVHGAYVARALDDGEQRIHDAFLYRIRHDFVLNASSDEVAAQMATVAFVQYLRAQKAEREAAAAIQARIVRNCLRDLKATKSARERGIVPLKTTPAEWAAALVKRMEKDGEAMRKRKAKQQGRPRKHTEPTATAQDTPA
jgi:hypothetical protein